MFIQKKKYYLIIENIRDINLKNLKKRSKFVIIYRNKKKETENEKELLKFRKFCKVKSIDFFVANNLDLANKLSSDGIYLSSNNNSLKALSIKKFKFRIIGSAHSIKEIYMKAKQGCKTIFLSKLFVVNYDKHAPFLGVIRFNNFLNVNQNLIPLGGINVNNLNSLKMVKCKGLAIMSEIKKKPANIINRLF